MTARLTKIQNSLWEFMHEYKQWGNLEKSKTEGELNDIPRKQLKAALDRMETGGMNQDMEICGTMNILNLVCLVAFASDPALLKRVKAQALKLVRIPCTSPSLTCTKDACDL